MPKKFSLVLALVIMALAGFLREFIFTRINEYLFALWYDEPSYAIQSLPILSHFNYETLYWTKWGLTLIFTLFFFGLTTLVLGYIFNKSYWKETAFIYLILLMVAGGAMIFGFLINDLHKVYPFARFIMGIAQSPILLMILIPGIWLKQQSIAANKL